MSGRDEDRSVPGQRNQAKNPLLSHAVTGLSIDDFMRSAVLVPALPTQTQEHTASYVHREDTISPTAIPPEPEAPKPTPKMDDDDDFDVNTYLERLRVSRYVSAPKTAEPAQTDEAIAREEEEFSEVNLDTSNEDDKSDSGQGITSDIAQNISQLPQVLPQVASAVFSSFSNMLRGSPQTPQSNQSAALAPAVNQSITEAQSSVHGEEAVAPANPVPMLDSFQFRNGQSADRAGAGDTSNLFRLNNRQKKTYAQIPGIRLGEIEAAKPLQPQGVHRQRDASPLISSNQNELEAISFGVSNPLTPHLQAVSSQNIDRLSSHVSPVTTHTQLYQFNVPYNTQEPFINPSTDQKQDSDLSQNTGNTLMFTPTPYKTTSDLVPTVPYAPKRYLNKKPVVETATPTYIDFFDPSRVTVSEHSPTPQLTPIKLPLAESTATFGNTLQTSLETDQPMTDAQISHNSSPFLAVESVGETLSVADFSTIKPTDRAELTSAEENTSTASVDQETGVKPESSHSFTHEPVSTHLLFTGIETFATELPEIKKSDLDALPYAPKRYMKSKAETPPQTSYAFYDPTKYTVPTSLNPTTDPQATRTMIPISKNTDDIKEHPSNAPPVGSLTSNNFRLSSKKVQYFSGSTDSVLRSSSLPHTEPSTIPNLNIQNLPALDESMESSIISNSGNNLASNLQYEKLSHPDTTGSSSGPSVISKFSAPFSNVSKLTSAVTSFFDPSYYNVGKKEATEVEHSSTVFEILVDSNSFLGTSVAEPTSSNFVEPASSARARGVSSEDNASDENPSELPLAAAPLIGSTSFPPPTPNIYHNTPAFTPGIVSDQSPAFNVPLQTFTSESNASHQAFPQTPYKTTGDFVPKVPYVPKGYMRRKPIHPYQAPISLYDPSKCTAESLQQSASLHPRLPPQLPPTSVPESISSVVELPPSSYSATQHPNICIQEPPCQIETLVAEPTISTVPVNPPVLLYEAPFQVHSVVPELGASAVPENFTRSPYPPGQNENTSIQKPNIPENPRSDAFPYSPIKLTEIPKEDANSYTRHTANDSERQIVLNENITIQPFEFGDSSQNYESKTNPVDSIFVQNIGNSEHKTDSVTNSEHNPNSTTVKTRAEVFSTENFDETKLTDVERINLFELEQNITYVQLKPENQTNENIQSPLFFAPVELVESSQVGVLEHSGYAQIESVESDDSVPFSMETGNCHTSPPMQDFQNVDDATAELPLNPLGMDAAAEDNSNDVESESLQPMRTSDLQLFSHSSSTAMDEDVDLKRPLENIRNVQQFLRSTHVQNMDVDIAPPAVYDDEQLSTNNYDIPSVSPKVNPNQLDRTIFEAAIPTAPPFNDILLRDVGIMKFDSRKDIIDSRDLADPVFIDDNHKTERHDEAIENDVLYRPLLPPATYFDSGNYAAEIIERTDKDVEERTPLDLNRPLLPLASYFDSGNYATERHTLNTMTFEARNGSNKTDEEKATEDGIQLFDPSMFGMGQASGGESFFQGDNPAPNQSHSDANADQQFFQIGRGDVSFFDADCRNIDREKPFDRCPCNDVFKVLSPLDSVLFCEFCRVNSIIINFSKLNEMADEIVKSSSANSDPLKALSQTYQPVKYHWFSRKDDDGRSVWRPMSILDSNALEKAFHSETLSDSTIVSTDGGRFDVLLKQRKRIAVYWNEKVSYVRRCSWFYKGSSDAKFVPYPEAIAETLEAKYKQCMASGEWHQKVELPDGESVMMHNVDVIIHFLQHTSPDTWGSAPPTAVRPRVVKRGLEDLEAEDGEPLLVDHLLLLVHGVGSVCDLRFRTVEEVVDEFRLISLQLVQSHYKSAYEEGRIGRIEVLPISWHSSLHSDETGIDKQIDLITLESIPKLRNFTNDTLLDILFYTSPVFCQSIMNTVGRELNRIYSLFQQRNPGFKGAVSLGGHSLGSLIMFDLLCHQKSELINHKIEAGDASTDEARHSSTREATSVKYVLGAAGTGQPFITYPSLDFKPNALFALGSPVGMFECVRGIDTLGEDFALPTCPAFFNIFHPYDPVAYRIEPLINRDLANVKPVLIPHHKGRKRMHLELKETMARMGTDIRQRLVDSIKGTLSAVWSTAIGKTTTPPSSDALLEKVVEEHMSQEGDLTEQSGSHLGAAEQESCASQYKPPDHLGNLNGGRRVDYVLQEAPFEVFNEYIFAMASHLCYWESEDTMLLILREIYDTIGVSPDSRIPQQTMTVEVERPAQTDKQHNNTRDSIVTFMQSPQKYASRDTSRNS